MGSMFLSSWINSIDFTSATNPLINSLLTEINSVSAYVDNLSAYVNSIDFTSATNPVLIQIQTDVNSLSSDVDKNYSSLLSTITSLSSDQENLKIAVDTLSATGIADSFVKFGVDALSGRDTLILSASSEVVIQVNQTHNWVFNASGGLVLAGGLAFSTGPSASLPYTSPVELDMSTTVQKINTGYYHLKNGYEGQIMYFVPKPNSLGDFYTQIRVDNVRYWSTDAVSLIRTPAQGSMYWIPWMLRSHRLDANNYQMDPTYDLFPTVATAIFTDGAWNLSTGRYG